MLLNFTEISLSLSCSNPNSLDFTSMFLEEKQQIRVISSWRQKQKLLKNCHPNAEESYQNCPVKKYFVCWSVGHHNQKKSDMKFSYLYFFQRTQQAPTPCTPPTRAMRSCSMCPPCCHTCLTTHSRWALMTVSVSLSSVENWLVCIVKETSLWH